MPSVRERDLVYLGSQLGREFLVTFWMNFQGECYLKSDSLLRTMSLYNSLNVQSLIVFFNYHF